MSLKTNYEPLLTSLRTANLLPSAAIPDGFTPKVDVKVSFGEKVVGNGELVRAGECKVEPRVEFGAEASVLPNTKYTLLLVDPDAPTPDSPHFAYWRHWIVSSLPPSPSSSPSSFSPISPSTITKYLGPGPKDDSGPHRYLFLLYREPEEWVAPKTAGDEFVQRRSFKVEEWVEKAGLVLVGVAWMKGVGDGWAGEI